MKRTTLAGVLATVCLVGLSAYLVVTSYMRPAPAPTPPRLAGNPPSAGSSVARMPASLNAQPGERESVESGLVFDTADQLWQRPVPEEAFARFHDWAENYRQATADARARLESEGVELASARRTVLR